MKLLQEAGIDFTAAKGFVSEGIDQCLGFLISPFDRLVSFWRGPVGKSQFLKQGRLSVKGPLHFHAVDENTRPVAIRVDLPDVTLAVDHLVSSLHDLEPKVAGSVQGLVLQFDHLVLMSRPVNLERSKHPSLVVHADESPGLRRFLVDPREQTDLVGAPRIIAMLNDTRRPSTTRPPRQIKPLVNELSFQVGGRTRGSLGMEVQVKV